MYYAKTRANLNYRDRIMGEDGSLGEKLGTFLRGTQVFVLDISQNNWATLYKDSRLVYVSNTFLAPTPRDKDLELPEAVMAATNEFQIKILELQDLYKDLHYMLGHLSEYVDDGGVPNYPSFNRRVSDFHGMWLAPVYSDLLSSDEEDHTIRNSPTLAWDLSVNLGDPVYAISHGNVVYTYRTKDDNDKGPGKFGTFCIIEHEWHDGEIYRFWYCHLNRDNLTVNTGDTVDISTQIGTVSWEGLTSFGPHLHLQCKQADGTRFRIDNFWDSSDFYYHKFASQSNYE